MKEHDYVAILEKQGFLVSRVDSKFWLKKSSLHWTLLPTLESKALTITDVAKSFFVTKSLFLSYLSKVGKENAFEYVFSGSKYGFDCFSGKIRNQVKLGLRKCLVRQPSLDEMIRYGIQINSSVFAKHDRYDSNFCELDKWKRYISPYYDFTDIWIRAAFVDNHMVAYCIFMQLGNKVYIFHPFIDYNFSSLCPMNAILYSFINEYLTTHSSITVSYGLESFFEMPGLDRFKKNMLFEKKPVCRLVLVNPIFRLFFNKPFWGIFSFAKKWVPKAFVEFVDEEFWNAQKKNYYSAFRNRA